MALTSLRPTLVIMSVTNVSSANRPETRTTLPRRYYTDIDVYRAEIAHFFFHKWICVGRVEQVANPGDYFLVELGEKGVNEESVIVTRASGSNGEPGELRAHYNVCRHRGTRMCAEAAGTFANNRIRCPYHAWTYGLDGALIAAPHVEIDKSQYPLKSVQVADWNGHIFLNFAENPARIHEQLSDLTERFAAWNMAELRRHKRIVYDVRANWKLIIANYNECLHCPPLHPALNRLTDYMGADNVEPTDRYVGGYMGFKSGIETMSIDGKRGGVKREGRAYLPGLNEAQRKQVAYFAIFPNLLLSLHPDYMMTHTIWPRGVDRTEIVCEFHFHPDELAKPDFQADDAIEFWDLTNREDWRISEMSQLGISSRAYTPGPYAPREELLWSFDDVILAAERERSKV